jgi:chromosome condensin MukBEF MukE localization factor
VKQLADGEYHVTVTESELSLIRSALDEAERVSRFGIEVLDEADRSGDSERSADSRLLREIDGLAMREASLRSLQKTMAEADADSLASVPAQAPLFTRGGW